MQRLLVLVSLGIVVAFRDNIPAAILEDMKDIQNAQTSSNLVTFTLPNSSFTVAEHLVSTPLLVRQSRCPLGSYPCESFCCSVGMTCVADGCCPNGEQQCGSAHCYNPTTEICCGEDGSCQRGYDCVTGGCCPSGQILCGAQSCYNPKTSVCCGATGYYCTKGYDCVGNSQCCPTGEKPCGTSKCYNPATQVCCSDGACRLGETCCGKGCCPASATCGGDGRCTKVKTTTRAVTTTIPIKTTTTRSCSTPTLTNPQSTTQTIKFAYDPNRQVEQKIGPSAGSKIPAPNRGVIINICDGINEVNGGKGGNTLQLTHGGKCFQMRNRKSMCENKGRRCKDAINDYIQSFYPSGVPTWAQEAITAAGDLTCDEFPFASSIEGGDPSRGKGITKCVPSDENNWQGGTMSSYFKMGNRNYVQPGEKYHIEVVGWDCNKQEPAKRSPTAPFIARNAFTSADGVKRTGVEMFKGYDPSDPNKNLMSMPLGDLAAGSYIVNLTIRGAFNLSLADNNGESFDFTQNSDGSILFTLDNDEDAVGLSGMTYDDDVEVVYQASQVDIVATTAPTSTPTESKKSGEYKEFIPSLWAVATAMFSGLIINQLRL
ncbi:hypothetical protein HD806DRAFT_359034 [Xylariaceae sp. AK1471]|nr:hypothetical protein HD806DRAFT_359034 [Xylariaceae sp. AK1471]